MTTIATGITYLSSAILMIFIAILYGFGLKAGASIFEMFKNKSYLASDPLPI